MDKLLPTGGGFRRVQVKLGAATSLLAYLRIAKTQAPIQLRETGSERFAPLAPATGVSIGEGFARSYLALPGAPVI
jgi:hypothetical protein